MSSSGFDDLAPPGDSFSSSGSGGRMSLRGSSGHSSLGMWDIAKGVCIGMLMYSVIATILGSLVFGLIVPGCVKRALSDEMETIGKLFEDVDQLTTQVGCTTCGGLGMLPCRTCSATGRMTGYGGAATVCTACSGMGRTMCPDCRGP